MLACILKHTLRPHNCPDWLISQTKHLKKHACTNKPDVTPITRLDTTLIDDGNHKNVPLPIVCTLNVLMTDMTVSRQWSFHLGLSHK